jgi:hypothetical protein
MICEKCYARHGSATFWPLYTRETRALEFSVPSEIFEAAPLCAVGPAKSAATVGPVSALTPLCLPAKPGTWYQAALRSIYSRAAALMFPVCLCYRSCLLAYYVGGGVACAVASSVLPYHDPCRPRFPYPGVGSVCPTTPHPDSRQVRTRVVVVGVSWLHQSGEQRRRRYHGRLDYRGRRRRLRWSNRRDEVVVYTGTGNATFPRCCTFGSLL